VFHPPTITVPNWVRDHESFRRWARSKDCPEKVRLAFYRGALWLDLAPEELYSHNQVKGEVCAVLHSRARVDHRGRYATAGMLLSLPDVGLSCMPDGLFISYDSLRSGRVRGVGAETGDCVELEGPPDMVLEIVSDSSETKDLVDLRTLYAQAGVPEYWLIDARSSHVRFELLRREPRGYSVTRPDAGDWQESVVFGLSFRLVSSKNPMGEPTYTLEVK
jgi:Uma2 family endonuclease